jgi:hypothetical protein
MIGQRLQNVVEVLELGVVDDAGRGHDARPIHRQAEGVEAEVDGALGVVIVLCEKAVARRVRLGALGLAHGHPLRPIGSHRAADPDVALVLPAGRGRAPSEIRGE